jgi:hydrogenase maturation protein HypF
VLTSSCGRLFDAISALLGFCDIITYEAQAAIRLQTRAERSRSKKTYPFALKEDGRLLLDPSPCIRCLVEDIRAGENPDDCARKFHNGLAAATTKVCMRLRQKTCIKDVCLSGGVFQNKLLLETLLAGLRRRGFRVYFNQLLPANDGAVSLGQAVIASAK